MFATYGAFDAAFLPRHRLTLRGIPSRVRGGARWQTRRHHRLHGGTLVGGERASDFSTLTSCVDLSTGAIVVDDMETFTVWQDGSRFHAADFNFWGVEGELKRRGARVVRAGIACSRHRRITRGWHSRNGGRGRFIAMAWRLSILDLASGVGARRAQERRRPGRMARRPAGALYSTCCRVRNRGQ